MCFYYTQFILIIRLETYYTIIPGTQNINETFIIPNPILNIPLRNIEIIQQFIGSNEEVIEVASRY